MEAESNGTTLPAQETPLTAEGVAEGKGKGKAVEQVPSGAMEEDDEEDEEEEEEEEEPSGILDPEEDPDDDMAEIEEDNIVGSRTRGKTIDYVKAAENMDDDDEYDEDDDEDFEDEDNDEAMG